MSSHSNTIAASKVSIQKQGLIAGLFICSALIAYFLLLKVSGLVYSIELRSLNFFILLGGVLFMFRRQRLRKDTPLTYLEGFGLGCYTVAISVFTFAIFIFIYFSLIDSSVMLQLKDPASLMGSNVSPITLTASILMEGLCTGLLIVIAYMQYYKSVYLR